MEKEAPFKARMSSRKFVVMIMSLVAGTGILLAPAVLKLIAGLELGALMTGGEYVSLVIGTFAIYSGANVAQRKIEAPKEKPNE